jgi:beta-galactosidase
LPNWTRRDLLKVALAASAEAAATKSALPFSTVAGTASVATLQTPSALPSNAARSEAVLSPRQRLLLDFGWRFHLGHAQDPIKDFGFGAQDAETFAKSDSAGSVSTTDFDDKGWAQIDLPHDWALDLTFKNAHDLPEHGGKPLGRDYPDTSIGWYRRVFEVPASALGKRIAVEFDGVGRNAMVLFNGHYLGVNLSGYVPFRFDLTDFVEYGGKNVLAVRADASLGEGWFYEGAGIYRHTWLTFTDPLHVRQWGNQVTAEKRADVAIVNIRTEVENESTEDKKEDKTCRVISRLVDADGKVVASTQTAPARIPAGGSFTFEAQVTINTPRLWALEDPYLYRAVTTIESNGAVTDGEETSFGIRSIRFDAEDGFFLNEKPVKIKGTCNHQDHAGVGVALPDRLQYYRIERLKEMGSNGYRTSHNPPTPELLDACDRLGMLVMAETRMMSSCPEGLNQLERMIRRDRNHPSIVLWSLGNEEGDQGSARGARMVANMKRLTRKLDPTRPVTVAMNGSWGKGVSNVVDVQGFNYGGSGGGGGVNTARNIDAFHQKVPAQPAIGSETASVVGTRGIYEKDEKRGYVSAYDASPFDYTTSSEEWWTIYDERKFLCGGFAWTGFDYRGEPSPYRWPCISSHFGIMDTCGFPKDNYFYYQAWWGTKPVLHLFPHWNWSGKQGQQIAVWCFTNLDSVELFLNGTSLGSKQVKRNSHVEWKVKYTPGVIEARGWKDGKVVLTARRETTDAPARIVLRPDRKTIHADGEDVSVAVVEVVDGQGRVVPLAMNEVLFRLTGPGRLIGLGNGDPSCHEPDKPGSPIEGRRSAFNGLCMALVQSVKQSGSIRIDASSEGLASASVTIEAAAARSRPAMA